MLIRRDDARQQCKQSREDTQNTAVTGSIFVVFFPGAVVFFSGFVFPKRAKHVLPTTCFALFPQRSCGPGVETAMSVIDDATHPDVGGGGGSGAAGNAADAHPWTADLDALRQHINTRLNQQVDSMAQIAEQHTDIMVEMQGMLQHALPVPGIQQRAPMGGNERAGTGAGDAHSRKMAAKARLTAWQNPTT